MEALEPQNFVTPAGIIRRGTKRQGALYEATLFPGVFTDQEVVGEILKTLNLAQAMMHDRSLAKEARKAAYAALVAALDRSPIAGPGKGGSIEEIEQAYANDPVVIGALGAWQNAIAHLEEVFARPAPKVQHCWADEDGPVEMVGIAHAISSIDGTIYTLRKGGVWAKDAKKGH